MIELIFLIYIIFAGITFLLYTPKLIQFFYAFKKPPYKKAKSLRKISLIVPARNESEVIDDLFDSIEKQTYNPELFDVNIIVQSKTDPTVKKARERGYNVFVVERQTCKGEALDGYFKQLEKERFQSYDAFVIIDADAVLAPDYVTELNNALEHNFQIFLTRKNIKNYLGDRDKRTVFSNCSALIYPIIDNLGNNYRMEHNIPLNMCGQGMMLRREVIEQIDGWPYRSLTEDYELKFDSVLHGFTSMYYPYAIIYTEEVIRHKDSYYRRLRWITGRTQCEKMYRKQIREQVKERGATGAERFEYFFATIPIVLFVAITALTVLTGAGVTIYYSALHDDLWRKAGIVLIALPFGIMYALLFLYSGLAMLIYKDVFKPLSAGEKTGMLFFSPLFMFEYFPIYLHSLICVRKGLNWQPTKRVTYEKGTVADKAEHNDVSKHE